MGVTVQSAPATDQPAWEAVAGAAVVTATMAEDALLAMELKRARYMDAHRPAAERIAGLAPELGRPDLEMRARLVLADIAARQGSPLPAAGIVEDISARAARAGETYLLARSHFLLATIQHALGDLPSARIHGIRSVELLPEDSPHGIMIDHLIMLAVAYGPGPNSARCYARALDLAAVIGDADKAIGIHNNIAYNAWEVRDLKTATEHVMRMLELSHLRDLPLKASPVDTLARVYILNDQYEHAIAVLEPIVSGAPGAFAPDNAGVLYTEPYALPECMITMAEAQRTLGRFDEAHALLGRALAMATQRGLGATYARALEEQARLHAATGDFRSAYEQHVAFHDAVNQLHSAEEESRARIVQASFDADERRRDSERFRELAMRDALTGLYNRRFLDDQLAALSNQAAGSRTALSAAIIDADFFKRINDELSHKVGDQVLRTLAGVLASSVIEPETVGRLGGEEFLFLMPGLSATEAHERCERLRRAVEDYPWNPMTGSIPVTVSIGLSTAPAGQTSPAALLSDADRNLYVAKRSGRNRVVSGSL